MSIEKKYLKLLFIFLFCIFCYAFTSWFLTSEKHLYHCDLVEFNLFYNDYLSGFFIEPIETIKKFANYVYNSNRTPAFCLFLLPFYPIFKSGRFPYMFLVEIVFMLPVMLLLTNIVINYVLKDKEVKDCIPFIALIISTIFFFPPIWHPVLNGIPDICGLPFILCASLLYFKNRLDSKTSFLTLFLMGFCLYLSFYTRRWYAISIFVFILSIFIENFIQSSINYKNFKSFSKKIAYTMLNLLIISLFVFLFSYAIQGGYLSRIFEAESFERELYLVDYNQWKYLFIENLGLITLLLSIVGFVSFIKNSVVRFVFLNSFLFAFTYIVLMDNQFIWINHFVYIAAFLSVLVFLGMFKLSGFVTNKKLSSVLMFLFVAFNLYNFSTCFVIQKPQVVPQLFSGITSHPQINPDYENVRMLKEFFAEEFEKNNNLKVAQLGMNLSVGPWQFWSLDIISKEFKNVFLFETLLDNEFQGLEVNADYIILINPLNVSFDEKNCRVLNSTVSQFENGTGIAKNYKLINEFKLEYQQSTLKLFKKERNLTKKQIKEYLTPFYEYYPDWKDREELNKLYT